MSQSHAMNTPVSQPAKDDPYWGQSLTSVGVKTIDRTLSANANWDEILQSGREEVSLALSASKMMTGRSLRLLDIGCGIGRLSYCLAEHFGEVVGVDIAEPMLLEAQSHNKSTNVTFRMMSLTAIESGQDGTYDTVFANEVFHYLDWKTLTRYSQDAYRLLRPNGEYVFQMNMEPFSLVTRASLAVRTVLYGIGVKQWRGWPTSPQFMRHYHPASAVYSMLQSVGFCDIRVTAGRSIRQTWFVARRP